MHGKAWPHPDAPQESLPSGQSVRVAAPPGGMSRGVPQAGRMQGALGPAKPSWGAPGQPSPYTARLGSASPVRPAGRACAPCPAVPRASACRRHACQRPLQSVALLPPAPVHAVAAGGLNACPARRPPALPGSVREHAPGKSWDAPPAGRLIEAAEKARDRRCVPAGHAASREAPWNWDCLPAPPPGALAGGQASPGRAQFPVLTQEALCAMYQPQECVWKVLPGGFTARQAGGAHLRWQCGAGPGPSPPASPEQGAFPGWKPERAPGGAGRPSRQGSAPRSGKCRSAPVAPWRTGVSAEGTEGTAGLGCSRINDRASGGMLSASVGLRAAIQKERAT